MPGVVDVSTLFEDAHSFLTDLSENNNREWFQDHKTQYDTQIKRPAERFMADVTTWLSDQIGTTPKAKLFRPHRDVRFSKDKTPYHTHLHVLWTLADGRGWMMGISPTYATAGSGIMGFEKGQIDAYRAAIDRDAGAELETILTTGDWRLDDPELKRVPAPYSPDHPRAELLRRKSLVVWRDDLHDALRDDMRQALVDAFTEMSEVQEWLGRALS